MAIKAHKRRYVVSLILSAVAATGVLSGSFLFVWWTGWGGAAGILTAAGMFLAWFYKGKRPDLVPRKGRREGG
ncbi:MAG: hypothetical protein M1377_07505 [Deltaproteobacteria bacterium]|nr:hypothetical protein [Deltaproteobacteria bacterium]